MPQENPELHIVFHPVVGEPLAVKSRDFASLESAVDAVTEALEAGHTLRFELNGRDDVDSGTALVNCSNVVAVKVRPVSAKGADDGQYL
ncbi:hypothetical protein G5C60_24655 [Streptomyces sp. HC44]|uniref:Uncharacterized protein n=1 Tax=Streptomyces scabichelini TaxID=2711217 RepID=A0A6G4V9E3_9ACTN|nr:hypothetical protein [Streptomyces scabichelini]NGO10699.1 hypothetical protein [Streptomyces scabichelini]